MIPDPSEDAEGASHQTLRDMALRQWSWGSLWSAQDKIDRCMTAKSHADAAARALHDQRRSFIAAVISPDHGPTPITLEARRNHDPYSGLTCYHCTIRICGKVAFGFTQPISHALYSVHEEGIPPLILAEARRQMAQHLEIIPEPKERT